jgi:hypothetical protein
MPAVQSAVLAEVEPTDIGKAAGLFNTLRQLGGVAGVALVSRCSTVWATGPQQFNAGFAAVLMVFRGALAGRRRHGAAP